MRMLKGAQKQMIVIRTGDSRYFDEAYFVLRKEVKTPPHTEHDMLREANRILAESEPNSTMQKKRRSSHGILLFLLGILSGSGVASLVCLLLF